jgi:hypothetical protein
MGTSSVGMVPEPMALHSFADRGWVLPSGERIVGWQ